MVIDLINKEVKVAIIIVTHNSELYIDKALENIDSTCEIIIVDSGSASTGYLLEAQKKRYFKLIKLENVGFAKANNVGYINVSSDTDYIVFVNPDLFLTPGWLTYAANFMSQDCNSDVAVFSSALVRYDIKNNIPLGVYDSLGIGKHGFWVDLGQGKTVENYGVAPNILDRDAICGALMFCRKKALDLVCVNGQVFWEKLFMYKEDIELSIRLKKANYRLCVDINSINYHCRGWKKRKDVPKWAKLISARNDLLIAFKYNLSWLPLFFIKYIYVRFFEK